MTSKHIKRFLSTIAIVSMSVSTVQADNIKIAELNWQSGSMIANIDAYILSNGYGHYTELVPGGIDATIQSMMATGSPNIFGEAWTSLLGDSALEYINNGTLIQVRDEVVVGAGESWYIPNYIQEQYGLNTIEDVLARPDLFPHPEDSSKGGIVICPEGWSCKKHNENLFRAFDMEAKGWKIIDPGSGTGLNAFWEGQVVKEKGAFGYYWAPTVLVGRLGLVSLQSELGFTGDENWSNCISVAVEECENPQATSFPVAQTGTIVTSGLNSEVVDYVTARGLDGSVITDMLVWSDDNQATSEDAAVEFLNRYPEIWTTWVTTDAANKITESLQ
jgi:glycine betaine/proline transport system substrate-binding protein